VAVRGVKGAEFAFIGAKQETLGSVVDPFGVVV
jgi:hypothetical protein